MLQTVNNTAALQTVTDTAVLQTDTAQQTDLTTAALQTVPPSYSVSQPNIATTYYGPTNATPSVTLPPIPSTNITIKPSATPSSANPRNVNNRPDWLSTVRFHDDEEDSNRSKRARAFVTSGQLLATTPSSMCPIPLKVDNNMPAIELRFGTSTTDGVQFLCHLDTCGGMNTGSLLLHQWLMTNHPSIVHKYEEYRDPEPFEPLSLDGAVPNPTSNNVSNKLTSVVTYRTRYTSNENKPVIMSIGLGESIQVNCSPILYSYDKKIQDRMECSLFATVVGALYSTFWPYRIIHP